ncbi:ammonium transporter [Rhodococcus sp. BP-252]|uniref:ammonium transporter n=1 Tax=unclassified Rhodococcus (in: high G+C Gram-positive bacteria) TaxID=192944 RepID=UPI001C9BBA95|nr:MULTISPECIES: ammonium transporter [unclassified Rhodococcus (in: high G+C Gram-positive bacteria)]MBY6412212.1 ammonium transporter [Rhodococcus sp. BP-320]MBY6416792.1 ammonium transporter [Rhodococcus sp. BP-321]MBY6421670.1 ammonium transporter [Rhodococcus sp. BP-324]MBY6426936.1 ammonium transporter [Rhodococcus sp. BP-323]MBY6432102.1 ammonium transporter [Rhodococcus sp. BP-322]
MKLSKLVVTAAFVASAMGLASGTAYADPATDAPAQSDDINYTVEQQDRTIVTTIDAGVFKVADDGKTVDVLDQADKVVVTLPLSFNLGGLNFPYEQNVDNDGKTLRLVPQLDLSKASANSKSLGATPVASPDENLKAQQTFASQLGLATAIGGLTGTIIGAGIGFLAGLPLLGAGGVITIPIAAGAGGVIGTIVAGGPTLVIAGIDLINTLLAPPGTTKFAN